MPENGLYRCKHAATPLISIYTTVHLEVLPHNTGITKNTIASTSIYKHQLSIYRSGRFVEIRRRTTQRFERHKKFTGEPKFLSKTIFNAKSNVYMYFLGSISM